MKQLYQRSPRHDGRRRNRARGGWILVEKVSIAAVGAGAEPAADERIDLAARSSRRASSTRTTTSTRPSRAPGPRRRPLQWLRELYPVWAGIDAEAEYAAARTGLAELALSGCTTVFDHHYVFPRGRDGLIEAEVQAARELGVRHRRLARLDGPRRLRRRPAAGRARRGHRRRARRDRAARRRAARAGPGRPVADRGRAVLAVLRHGRADGRSRPSSPAGSACACTRTSPRPSRRRSTASSSTAAGRSSTSSGSAGSPTTSGARTASTSPTTTIAQLRRARAPASRTARPRTCASAPGVAPVRDLLRRRRARRARRRRLGLERAQRPLLRGQAGAARRARPGRAGAR